MAPAARRLLAALMALALSGAVAGCGTHDIEVAGETDPGIRNGAELFAQRCSGCHTLRAAGAQGSADRVNDREYKDGPNFNVREEQYDGVIYAIRNGGFSSGPMPQNIVVGREAEDVARFVARYSGREAKNLPTPEQRQSGENNEQGN